MRKQKYRREAQQEVKQDLKPNNTSQILNGIVADKLAEGGVRFVYKKEAMEKEVMTDHVVKYRECYDTPSLLNIRSIWIDDSM